MRHFFNTSWKNAGRKLATDVKALASQLNLLASSKLLKRLWSLSSSLSPDQPWLVFLQLLFFPTPPTALPTAADLKETAISCCCPYRSDCRAVKRPASKVKIQQLPYVHRTLNLQFLPKHCTWPTCAQPFCFVWFKRPAFRDSIAEMWLVVKISPFLGSYYNTAPIF